MGPLVMIIKVSRVMRTSTLCLLLVCVGTLAKVLALVLKCILVSAHVLIYHMSSQEIF